MTIPKQTIFDPEVPCVHHWVIELANGSTSQGVCIVCFEVKEFRNSGVEVDWNTQPKQSKETKRARQEAINNENIATDELRDS